VAARHRLYLSYRRTDASYACRLSDELAQGLGRNYVFVDVDRIEPGTDWVRKLQELVKSASVVLAVIGPGWADDDGWRRLNESGDFVRQELATALMSDCADRRGTRGGCDALRRQAGSVRDHPRS
jgi:hypothetical protein